jgi:hypothetical protein
MNGKEYFRYLAYHWDVTAAKQIARTLPVRHLNPRPWFTLLAGVALDELHIPHVDLAQPLIVVRVPGMGGGLLVIDGWHRLARARSEGVNELPFVLLDGDQERQVWISGGSKSPEPPEEPHVSGLAADYNTTVSTPFLRQIETALLGEVADHFTGCGGDRKTYAGLEMATVRQRQGAVDLNGVDRETGSRFSATVTVEVTAALAQATPSAKE